MTTNQLEKAQERVTRGAAWLDKNHEGWWRKIRTTSLDMSEADVCIIGQLSDGHYWPSRMGVRSDRAEVSLGFHSQYVKRFVDDTDYYEALDNLWKAEVRTRRTKVRA